MNSAFRREDLGRRLGLLKAGHWIAFATGCSERLLPIFELGEEAWGWQGRSHEFTQILDFCWALALNPGDATARSRVITADWEGLVRDGNIDDSKGYRLFVYQAIPTLEVTLDCARSQTLERATFAAQKEFDAVYGISDLGLSPPRGWPGMSADEARAAENERLEKKRGHPLVQTCIRAQNESVDLLTSHAHLDKSFLDSFREKASLDGQLLLTLATEIYPRRP